MHLGDQIYGDQLWREYARDKSRSDVSAREAFQNAVHSFRELYRDVWTRDEIAPVLRRSSNLFLPDDHDTIDNLATNWLNDTKKPFIRAGRLAFLEFQHSVDEPLPIRSEAIRRCAATGGVSSIDCAEFDADIDLSRYTRRGTVGLATVDIRMSRSLQPLVLSSGHRLLDAKAMQRFEDVQ